MEQVNQDKSNGFQIYAEMLQIFGNGQPASFDKPPTPGGLTMAIVTCKHCGRKYSDQNPNGCICQKNNPTTSQEIVCPLCHQGAMEFSHAKIFTDSWVRACGTIIVIPSILGMASSVVYLFTGMRQAVDPVVHISICASAFSGSLVLGTLGWVLLAKKRVWKCNNCGHHTPRE